MTGPLFSWTVAAELVGGHSLVGCIVCGQGTATRWRDQGLHERCIPVHVERSAPAEGWLETMVELRNIPMTQEPDQKIESRIPELVRAYIESGGEVLPLHWRTDEGRCSCGSDCGTNQAKHPLTAHGLKDATTDLDTVARWAARWPRANWGLRPPKGIVVLDVDPRNGGHTSLADLQAEHGAVPKTLTAKTGGGGIHLWLTHHGPTRGKLARGVDVKTWTSGYVVAPPSVHITGNRYTWLDRRPTAVAPPWLRKLLDPTPQKVYTGPASGDIAGLVNFVAAAQEGERNRSLYWACCRAVEGGHDLAPLIAAGISIGLTTHEAHATARSARRGAAA